MFICNTGSTQRAIFFSHQCLFTNRERNLFSHTNITRTLNSNASISIGFHRATGHGQHTNTTWIKHTTYVPHVPVFLGLISDRFLSSDLFSIFQLTSGCEAKGCMRNNLTNVSDLVERSANAYAILFARGLVGSAQPATSTPDMSQRSARGGRPIVAPTRCGLLHAAPVGGYLSDGGKMSGRGGGAADSASAKPSARFPRHASLASARDQPLHQLSNNAHAHQPDTSDSCHKTFCGYVVTRPALCMHVGLPLRFFRNHEYP